jgi:hypothetical protein
VFLCMVLLHVILVVVAFMVMVNCKNGMNFIFNLML